MTLLILQMLGLLLLAALLGWLIGRWKINTLLAERDELHEVRMRSRFKKIEELKQSLNTSQSGQSGVDLEVHRMLEDRFHQLKQDHTRAQQLLQEKEQKLQKTQNELQQREQDLHEADQTLSKRDLELTKLQEKDREAQTLLSRVDPNSTAELETARGQLDTVREQLTQVQDEREAALARTVELEDQVGQLQARSELEQSKLRESVEQTQRNAGLVTKLQADLEQVREDAKAAEQASASRIEELQAQDSSASLDAALADATRWREAHDAANEKVRRTEALLAEAEQRVADQAARSSTLEQSLAELQDLQAESDRAQSQLLAIRSEADSARSEVDAARSEAVALRDQLALLGAARDKSEHKADVLKQVYLRMRDRYREADNQAQHLTEVSRDQAVSVADESANAARLLREKRELEERLEKNESVTSKLRAEFNKHFVLSARLQEALKGQQEQLSGAQLAIDRYEKAEAAARATSKDAQDAEQGQKQSSSAADEMISVLKSTVSKQRDRLALCREGIDELQQLLNADLSHAERTRRRRQPAGLSKVAANSPDNLQRIKGIGWRKEARLRSLGIDRYSDLARLSADDVLWLDQVMGLDGAVQRQDWVGQSRKLAVVASRGARRAAPAGTSAGIDRPIKRVAEPRRADTKKRNS